jgi:hypothetical protein
MRIFKKKAKNKKDGTTCTNKYVQHKKIKLYQMESGEDNHYNKVVVFKAGFI